MRLIVLSLVAALTACASSQAEEPRESIEVVYSQTMRYSIEDGGAARLIGANDHPVYEFEVSREDYRRVADLLEPLQAGGLPCSQPSEHTAPGHIVWRRGDVEVANVEMHTICYADGARPLAQRTDAAWRLMEEMGHARYVAPAIPEPTTITLQNLYWGRPTATWTIPRSGEGRYEDPQRTVTFNVSPETFEQIREIFRPYEARDFHCQRVIADGPYGYVMWSSQEGQMDQRTLWDAGCVTGDASDLFARIDTAMEILTPLRDAARN
jgi:hypothetical protein